MSQRHQSCPASVSLLHVTAVYYSVNINYSSRPLLPAHLPFPLWISSTMEGWAATGLRCLILVYGIGVFGASFHPPPITPWKVYNQSYVQIASSDVNSIPTNLPECITHVQFPNNNITHISASSFVGLGHLITLDIVHNPLRYIEERSFMELTKLERLGLSCSVETHLDSSYPYPVVTENVFYGLEKLNFLQLMIMGIEKLNKSFFTYMQNLEMLDLRRNPIQEIDADAFDYLEKLELLDLSYTYITELHPQTFQKLSKLKTLNIAPTRLHVIPSDALAKLHSLKILVIGGNFSETHFGESMENITLEKVTFQLMYTKTIFESTQKNDSVVTEGAFYHLRSRSLVVDNNYFELTSVMSKNLTYLLSPYLTSLSCSGVASLSLPIEIHTITKATLFPANVTKLNLSKNKVKTIKAAAFKNLRELQVLNLSSNILNELHKEAFWGLEKLEVLDLSKNTLDMKSVKALGVFSNQNYSLRVLNISWNTQLIGRSHEDKVFREIFNIPTLIELAVMSMDLSDEDEIMSGSLCGVPNLQVLSLRDNKLFKCGCLLEFSSLRFLDLANNQLYTPPTSSTSSEHVFSKLPNLEYLNLSGQKFDLRILQGASSIRNLVLMNRESTKDEDTWDNSFNSHWKEMNLQFPNLTELVLAHTRISYLSQAVFDSIPSAQSLQLNKNELTFLDMTLFKNLTDLHYLDMSGNSIVTIKGSSWHLPNLHTLLLARNALTYIPESFLGTKFLPSLRFLDLQQVILNCDCQLNWFRKWAHSDRIVVVYGFYDYQCSLRNDPEKSHMYLKDFDPWLLNCKSLLHVYLSVSLPCTIVVLAIISGLCLYNRLYVKGVCLKLKWKMQRYRQLPDLEESEKYFDAFVSYNSADEDWVARELLTHLEAGDPKNFNICVDFKNFIPGRTIIDNIIDSIQGSRKTILILTPNFVRSEWCYFEMEMAQLRLFEEGRDVVIPVLLEPIPDRDLTRTLRRLFARKTYIKWPRENNDTARELFWAKLKEAIKVPSRVDRR